MERHWNQSETHTYTQIPTWYTKYLSVSERNKTIQLHFENGRGIWRYVFFNSLQFKTNSEYKKDKKKNRKKYPKFTDSKTEKQFNENAINSVSREFGMWNLCNSSTHILCATQQTSGDKHNIYGQNATQDSKHQKYCLSRSLSLSLSTFFPSFSQNNIGK